jgi:hypothetical protein
VLTVPRADVDGNEVSKLDHKDDTGRADNKGFNFSPTRCATFVTKSSLLISISSWNFSFFSPLPNWSKDVDSSSSSTLSSLILRLVELSVFSSEKYRNN